MKRGGSKTLGAGLAVAAALCAAAGADPEGEAGASPAWELRLPLDRYPNGEVRVELQAARAEVPEQGDVTAWDAVVVFYDEEGGEESRIEAEEFRYDRQTGRAASDQPVKVEWPELTIRGTGFEWIPEEERVRVQSEVRVVLRRARLAKGRRDAR